MANCCYFQMNVSGQKDRLKRLVKNMRVGIDISESLKGKRFNGIYFVNFKNNDDYYLTFTGVCKWSVNISLLSTLVNANTIEKDKFTLYLEDASKELNLNIEVYSFEPNMNFTEHCYIKNGKIETYERGKLYKLKPNPDGGDPIYEWPDNLNDVPDGLSTYSDMESYNIPKYFDSLKWEEIKKPIRQ